MKLPARLLSSVLSIVCLASCQFDSKTSTQPSQFPNQDNAPGYTADGHQSQYGLDLFLQLARKKSQEQDNICLSPYSSSMALALVRPGARGETLRQIDRAIGKMDILNQQSLGTALPLEVVNRVYSANNITLKPEYKNCLPKDSLTLTNFAENPAQVCADINKWVSSHTRGRINDLLNENDLKPDTKLILINAISTKAKWQYPFETEQTHNENFHLETGQTISVPAMNLTCSFRYLARPDCEIIAIPFEKQPHKKETFMIVILPPKGTAIRQYMAGLTPAVLQNIRKDLASAQSQTVWLSIPKFKTEDKNNLSGYLSAAGMPDAFSLDKANFSGISETPLFIDSFKQNTWFEMKEEGIEAAAASAIGAEPASIEPIEPKTPPHFKADRPFIWMIADITPDTIPYFIGVLKNPTL